jgi:hypothetical protein
MWRRQWQNRSTKGSAKKITDGLYLKQLKDQNDNFDPEAFSGCLTFGLCTMVDVQNWQLEVNHTFPKKEILVLRVAEEANLQGINFVCTRSDLRDFKCTGPRFCVIARHSERQGWFFSVANICECDEFGRDVVDMETIPEKLTLPFRTKWVVPHPRQIHYPLGQAIGRGVMGTGTKKEQRISD